LGCFGVLLLALGRQHQAVLEARVAMELTVGASFGALHEVLGVFVLGESRLTNRGDGDGQRGYHQASSAKHRSSSKSNRIQSQNI